MTTRLRHAACLAFFLLAAPAWAQDTVLAKNAWTTVTKADFDAEIERIPENQRFTFLSSAERVAQTVKNILVNKTLAAQARAEKIDQEPAVQAEIAATAGKVLARHRLERAEAALKVPDFTKRAEELYRASPGKYAEKDVVHTMQILVDTKCRTADAAKGPGDGGARRSAGRQALRRGREEVLRRPERLPQRRRRRPVDGRPACASLRGSRRRDEARRTEPARAHQLRLPRHSPRKREEGQAVRSFPRFARA